MPHDNGFGELIVVACRGEQRGIAARGGGIGRAHPLQRKALEVIRPAGLWPGAGEALAAEGLDADHGADLIAVDIEIADLDPRRARSRQSPRCGCGAQASDRSRWH